MLIFDAVKPRCIVTFKLLIRFLQFFSLC